MPCSALPQVQTFTQKLEETLKEGSKGKMNTEEDTVGALNIVIQTLCS